MYNIYMCVLVAVSPPLSVAFVLNLDHLRGCLALSFCISTDYCYYLLPIAPSFCVETLLFASLSLPQQEVYSSNQVYGSLSSIMSAHNTPSPLAANFPFRASLAPARQDSVSSQSVHSESSEATSLSSVDDAPLNHQSKPLVPGVYVPTVTFFQPGSEDLDLPVIASHAVRLAQAGVAGIATQGSNGEAVHLSHAERKTVTRTTRTALDNAGFAHLPIIVGCGAQSTRETIHFCHEAAGSGGDYALILPPNYYKTMFTPETIREYFNTVADSSPVPVLIYNYPAAVSGIDLSSDDIIALSKHPNIAGCKLTCGNTGKLARIAAATSAASPEVRSNDGTAPDHQPFMCLGGSADFTLQTLIVGGSGVICGIGNVAPKACVQIFDRFAQGDLLGARTAQEVVARGDWAAISGGIVGTKSALQSYFGYGGVCRRPLPAPMKGEAAKFRMDFEEIVEYEKAL